jgi:hypothetical protein
VLTAVAILVAVVAALLIFANSRPGAFRVERATLINAPAEKIFSFIDDFHNWRAWSPWEKLDPNLDRTYSGPSRGKGAVYVWQGNSKAGEGRMEITEAFPPLQVVITLDFFKPMEGHNTAEFTLAPAGDFTNVTWAMYGPNRYLAKLMTVFISMDSILGKEFEKGLSSLKTVCEDSSA